MTKTEMYKKYGYSTIGQPSRNGRARVELNNKWGHADKNGKVTTPIIYNWVGDFFEDNSRVVLDEKYGHVDKNGKIVSAILWNWAADIKNNRARVMLKNVEGYIDGKGNVEEKYRRSFIKAVFDN